VGHSGGTNSALGKGQKRLSQQGLKGWGSVEKGGDGHHYCRAKNRKRTKKKK